MRFFRNPFVSGVLAAAAVVLVAYRLVLPRLRLGSPVVAALVNQIIAPAHAPTPSRSKDDPFVDTLYAGPDRGIDRNYIEGRFAKWVATPVRDPFLLLGGDQQAKAKDELEFASPIAGWKLNGIWNQTGSSLAVINNTVHQVGDEIEGYKIIRIEGEEVWFQGPRRKERLGLTQKGPVVLHNPIFMPATNQARPGPVPQ